MQYKKTVERIASLPWNALDSKGLLTLMVLSAYAAREFAESLRIALKLSPKHSGLKEMAQGELLTDNLRHGSYDRVGDHADFLWYFIEKEKIVSRIDSNIIKDGERYLQEVRKLPQALRAMSIVSREEELSGIFERVLTAPDWSDEALQAFQYYLKRHIALDSEEGGHKDLISDILINDSVDQFYQIRLKLYISLFPDLV